MAKKKKPVTKKDSPLFWIILAVLVFALLVFAIFKLGLVGVFLANLSAFIFGDFYWLFMLAIMAFAIYALYAHHHQEKVIKQAIGFILLMVASLLVEALLYNGINDFAYLGQYAVTCFKTLFNNLAQSYGAGLLAGFFYSLLYVLFAEVGTYVFLAVCIIISLILLIPLDVYRHFFFDMQELQSEEKKVKINQKEKPGKSFNNIELKPSELKDDDEVSYTRSPYFIDADVAPNKIHDEEILNKASKEKSEAVMPLEEKIAEKSGYHLPPINLLDNVTVKSSGVNKTSADIKGEKVIEILHNFGIDAALIKTHIGPSVTKFEIKPDSSVKVSKIQAISDNIKMELAAKDIRIEAPIPGRSAVGIEIPNVEPTTVRLYELIRQMLVSKNTNPLLFALGKDLLGQNVYCELDKMPHLLIAGATGSGKSVCINTVITSLLMRTYPDDVRLVLIDPKKVEFTPYHDVPHLLWPVITDATMAANMLKKIVVIMEERYEAFADVGVRNIGGFNALVNEHNSNLKDDEKPMTKMPYIVVIIDELADLMAIAGKEVELSIQRITQLARASGIHLIVATQRPSTDVITGIIKSNIPSRISFAVASSIDSRTILDQTGAERLLGNGDMLYAPQGENSPIRIQGVYVTDEEIKKITDYIKKEQKPVYEDSYFAFLNAQNGGSGNTFAKEEDALMEEVIAYVCEVQKASTSLLQRRFGIGYNRAARIIETLEERGIVGPAQGSKPREVYLKKEEES